MATRKLLVALYRKLGREEDATRVEAEGLSSVKQ